MKRLIVGDIHGCFAEFQELLDKAGLGSDDEIVAIGDIVDRGPESPRVLEFFQTQANAMCIMGNHEWKHIRSFRHEIRPALSQVITRRQIGEDAYPDAVTWMDELPDYLELPEVIVVHGFFEPGVPLLDQRETVIKGSMSGEKYLKQQYNRPWYELYDSVKPIVVGHFDYSGDGQPFVYRDRVFCIDTGCYAGRALTGLVAPDFRMVTVPSRSNYWAKTTAWYADIRLAETPIEKLSWEDAETLLASLEKNGSTGAAAIERKKRLRFLLVNAEKAQGDLFAFIKRENNHVLDQLCETVDFAELSPQEQGRVYAARIGRTPLASFLHRARKGELSLPSLRAHFKGPGDLLKFVARVGMTDES